MKIAYLVNVYPQISHSFIRREILALEGLGLPVERFTIRLRPEGIINEMDRQELTKTRIILAGGLFALLGALGQTLWRSPFQFLRALGLAWRVGQRSERGLGINLIYLLEACRLRWWLAAAQIDHLHAHFGTNSATVAMLCEVLGGPGYSFTVHGPEEFDKVAAIALPEKIKRAKFVVVISSYGRSQLYRWCGATDWPKIQLVRCGLDDGFLATDPSPLPETPRLVCVGRLSEQKGQLLLLQAVAILVQQGIKLQLVLVGDGPLRTAIESAIATLGLGDYVEIMGWATETAVKEQIQAARAMVLPSFAEGLPVVLMESLAMGRPVVSTYIAGIPELVVPGKSGWLVPAGDVAALAEALKEVLSASTDTLTAMGQYGREQVLQYHNVQREAQSLAALFAQYGDSTPCFGDDVNKTE